MGLKDTFFGTPTRTVLTLAGIGAVVVLIAKRKTVATAAGEAASAAEEAIVGTFDAAQLAATKLLMPSGTEYIADLAFELAPQYNVSPYIILGITYAESNFGRALTPKGPGGTGDFIPRAAGRCVEKNSKGTCVKTLRQLVDSLGFPVNVNSSGELVPTSRGWGHGLYQIDLMSHHPFIATGKWADAREAMKYALDLYSKNREQIRKAVPSIGPLDLVRATIASYNAGAGAVIKALKAGVPASKLDQGAQRSKGGTRVTYSEGYVNKILDKGASLTPSQPTV